jgi:UDP-3-O-[3-hydroxymyristoyl] glucosamine N-acyltransferase
LGGQVGVVGHITIAKGTQVQAQSGISRPALKKRVKNGRVRRLLPYGNDMRSQCGGKQVARIGKKVLELEKIITELKKNVQ